MADSAKNRIKSLNSEHQTYVKFKCRCRRKVSVYWHDFRGNLVRYCVLSYGRHFVVDTYVTHPWSARDWLTGDRLTLNGSYVYFPKPWTDDYPTDEERPVIFIDIPVYTLKERCEQVVRQMIPHQEINSDILDLPGSLTDDLRNVPNLQYSKYSNQSYQQNSEDEDESDDEDEDEYV